MTYTAELTLDLVFRGSGLLSSYLRRAGLESQEGDPAVCGWTIVASFMEFASGDLDGLHLTGVGGGRLLDGFSQRLRVLAIHADGIVAGVGEDGARWCHQLDGGWIITLPEAGRQQPWWLVDGALDRDHSAVDRLPLAFVPRSRL